jgi:Bacterial Ig-like domain (group 2)
MNNIKHYFGMLFIVMLFVGCPITSSVNSIMITANATTLNLAASQTITASMLDQNSQPTPATPVWNSSDPSVASVVGNGVTASLTALKAGTTTVTAKVGSVTSNALQFTISAASNTIAGTVYAAAGKDIKNTIVLACFMVNDACDDTKSDGVVITQTGNHSTYSIGNLSQGNYMVLALQAQFDNTGNISSLETLGVYLTGNSNGKKYTPVQLPASSIDLTLTDLANPLAGGNPVSNDPPTAVPTELQAEFFSGNPISIDYYNPVTGTFSPSSGNFTSYTFKPDGTFTFGSLFQLSVYSCTTAFFSYRTGKVQVNGSQLTLNFTAGTIKYTNSCYPEKNYDKPAPTDSQQYTWRVGIDPKYPNLTYLYLKDSTGREDSYLKKQ